MDTKIQSAYVVDGQVFASKKEATDYLRRPQQKEAFEGFISDNDDLVTWLLDNQEGVEMAFEVGTIKRVTKTESNQLEKALTAIVEAGEPKFAFVADNHEAILTSFRWPSVKRMDENEKAEAAMAQLTQLLEGNEAVASFIITNKEKVMEAYAAGKQKRKVSQKAIDALAAYRAEAKARKEAEAAE